MIEETFSDGNMADVVRVGDIVRKQRGTWWSATRQVLDHLEQANYLWSPRVIAENDTYVELTFVPGVTIGADLAHYDDEIFLREIGTRVRELHDALAGFHLTTGTECVPWPHQPDERSILCHNDLSPWNTVVQEGRFQGFIDWDLVSYGTREWELAWMCWRWAPIYPQGDRTAASAHEQANRCRMLLEAYGLDAIRLRNFVDLIDQRMRCGLDVVEILGAQGVPGFDRLLESGMHLSAHDDRVWLLEHRPVFQEIIES